MNQILLSTAKGPAFDKELLKGLFSFRYKMFYERLGWDVETDDGLERDSFDELNPVYVLSRNSSKEIEGCWRLLPTTGPYMLKDTFPQLLRGEKTPNDPAIWELSRFAVNLSKSEDKAQAAANPITFSMLRSVYDFAIENHIQYYVTVTSVAVERLMKRMGVPIFRFGDRKAQRIGKVLTVACWVAIDEQLRQAVYPMSTPATEVASVTCPAKI